MRDNFLSLKGRDFLTLSDFSADELWHILEKALEVEKNLNNFSGVLAGKFFALIFEKPSTRTRVSFEVAIRQLGGFPLTLNWVELQLGRGETVRDTAKTLERYVHGIIARVNEHKTLLELAKSAEIPVINALSNLYHPCQALADMLTVYKLKGRLKGLKLAWVGDGNNVCHSLLVACSKFGLDVSVATPKGYEPKKEVLEKALEEAKNSGSKIELTNNPEEAVKDADIVYTDTFVSMGKEAEKRKRLKVFLPNFQVTLKLFNHTKKDCVFMHCLPAKRGEEVTSEVIDGPRSVVWFQAENRLHLQRGLLTLIF
ncbi:MAG: ornithine carbamoyltransferase [Candidatus Hecatellales archaeon]|nr:MAG: ornithine carbamoyltransferase [Candidatus Hecatellales archaeon]